MPRPKRGSKVLEKAERRLECVQSIDPNLDLGNGLTIKSYTDKINELRNKLSAYNMALSAVDAAYNQLLEQEESLADLSEHMLLAVAAKFGKNSYQYEMAGGVRKSERKKRVRKATATSNGQPTE